MYFVTLVKLPNIRFHKNPFTGFRTVTRGQTCKAARCIFITPRRERARSSLTHSHTHAVDMIRPPIFHAEILWSDAIQVPAWLGIMSLRNCIHYDKCVIICRCRKTWKTYLDNMGDGNRIPHEGRLVETCRWVTYRAGQVCVPITGSNSRPHQIKSRRMPTRLFNTTENLHKWSSNWMYISFTCTHQMNFWKRMTRTNCGGNFCTT
jgi:hypothetical protein